MLTAVEPQDVLGALPTEVAPLLEERDPRSNEPAGWIPQDLLAKLPGELDGHLGQDLAFGVRLITSPRHRVSVLVRKVGMDDGPQPGHVIVGEVELPSQDLATSLDTAFQGDDSQRQR